MRADGGETNCNWHPLSDEGEEAHSHTVTVALQRPIGSAQPRKPLMLLSNEVRLITLLYRKRSIIIKTLIRTRYKVKKKHTCEKCFLAAIPL